MVLVAMSAMAQAPVVPQGGVVNGASFRPANAPGGGVSTGAIVSIFGSNLAASTVVGTSLPLLTSLGGTTVRIGGIAAPLFFVAAGQINAQVPWNVVTGTAQLTVTTAAGTSAVANVTIQDASPGLFSQTTDGRGPGAVQNYVSQQQTPINTPGVTINPGGTVVIYGTGFGKVSNPPADGAPATAATPTLVTPTVTIGGRQATVQYSGLTPGYAGLYQINAEIPTGTPEGCYLPITVTFGSTVSNTVTIGVTNNRVDCNTVASSGTAGLFTSGSFGYVTLTKVTWEPAVSIPGLGGLVPGIAQPADRIDGLFSRYEALSPSSISLYPPVNAGCNLELLKMDTSDLPNMAVLPDKPLNAGTLSLAGPGISGQQALKSTVAGQYSAELGQNVIRPGAYTLTGSGGADIGPFTSTLTLPNPLFTMKDFGLQLLGQFSQSLPLKLSWSCQNATDQVGVSVISFNLDTHLLGLAFCSLPCGSGSGQIPSDVLKQLPVSGTASAQILVFYTLGPTQAAAIKANGLTQGIFTFSEGVMKLGAQLVP
jgi:uncharacterized protein (TIGR03437 family)